MRSPSNSYLFAQVLKWIVTGVIVMNLVRCGRLGVCNAVDGRRGQCVLKLSFRVCVFRPLSAMSHGETLRGLPQQHGCSWKVAERTEIVYQRRLEWLNLLTRENQDSSDSAGKRFWFIYDQFDTWVTEDSRAIDDVLPPWQTKEREEDAGIRSRSPTPMRPEPTARTQPPPKRLEPTARTEGSPLPTMGSTDGPDVDAMSVIAKATDTAADVAAASQRVGDEKASDTVNP